MNKLNKILKFTMTDRFYAIAFPGNAELLVRHDDISELQAPVYLPAFGFDFYSWLLSSMRSRFV